jgi:hypothetical protein
MTTAGDNITKANIVAQMQTFDNYNTGIVWHSGNQPFQTDITGGNASGYSVGGYAADISDTNVTASTIVTNFRSYATLFSRIRSVQLKKWYQNGGDIRSSLQSDVTNITHLTSAYQADMSTIGAPYVPDTGNTISASALDQFVDQLSTAVSTARGTLVTIEEFYCHSNCHGSCHGSL